MLLKCPLAVLQQINFQSDFFSVNRNLYIIVSNMTEFFFLNFNSHFEAKMILKAKGDQKHLLWTFHDMKLFTGALN